MAVFTKRIQENDNYFMYIYLLKIYTCTKLYQCNIDLIKHSGIQNLDNLDRTAASISFSNFGVFQRTKFQNKCLHTTGRLQN